MVLGLSQDWTIKSAGGSTGNAFIGVRGEDHRVFLKRNTSPFLAALSAETITPKLLWTKRLSNGDIITAQAWINGRTLKTPELSQGATARLLAKVHSSNLLKNMLEKIGGSFVTPDQMLQTLEKSLQASELPTAVKTGIGWLEDHTLQVPVSSYRVCHGDLNKKNWLKTKAGQLYLVDWDQAMLADPVYDLTTVLMNYIPFKNWPTWLQTYGIALNDQLMRQIQWYAILQQVDRVGTQISQTTDKTVTSIQKLNTLINIKK